MEKISATENNKVDEVFTSDLGVKDEPKERVCLEILKLAERYYKGSCRQPRQIHRVPPQFRWKNEKRSEYDPMIVSLGPYHHGKPELHAAEEVKYRFLDTLACGCGMQKHFLYNMVLEKIDEIRSCYADNCVNKYSDRELATMMLLDSCFIIAFMEGLAEERDIFLDWHQCIGVANLQLTIPDILLLENQIPLQVIQLIVRLQRGKEGEELIQKFLNGLLSGDFEPDKTCISLEANEEHPLHLLEAFHRMITADVNCSTVRPLKRPMPTVSGFIFTKQDGDIQARSVMDLKAKGIECSPSSTSSVRDIKFKSGALRAELQLPVRMVWSHSLITLSNFIAYEMSPGTNSDFAVLSYTSLVKSLIESPEDVKELQEKGIVINRFQNHEQFVHELNGVDTFGLDNLDIFKDVKMEIEEHCRSKAKTWMADLIHTRFASPWTVTALFVATFLLCLTFLQTYFTVHPPS